LSGVDRDGGEACAVGISRIGHFLGSREGGGEVAASLVPPPSLAAEAGPAIVRAEIAANISAVNSRLCFISIPSIRVTSFTTPHT
jgi:hypothetical protein